ncbi:MAG: 50S ribosomal protein L15 [Candidatus Omnitrophica bacterium]|nr:50S ribosomal protein L15 [Candidatus Omnitrophota bacterium]
MQLNELRTPKGSRKTKRRVGRGVGSGRGKTCARGMGGQKKRKSPGIQPYFEGGQMPLIRRIPKRGFNNRRFQDLHQIVNISDLNSIKDTIDITPEILKNNGLIRYKNKPVKILGSGELSLKLNITAHAFSKSAKEKIESQGGKASLIGK